MAKVSRACSRKLTQENPLEENLQGDFCLELHKLLSILPDFFLLFRRNRIDVEVVTPELANVSNVNSFKDKGAFMVGCGNEAD